MNINIDSEFKNQMIGYSKFYSNKIVSITREEAKRKGTFVFLFWPSLLLLPPCWLILKGNQLSEEMCFAETSASASQSKEDWLRSGEVA